MIRTPEYIKYPDKSIKWNYEQGVMLEAMRKMFEYTNDKKYLLFAKEKVDRFVTDDGAINHYKESDYNLDKINSGKSLLFLYEQTKEEKYKLAADKLRTQLAKQPRTESKGFWHKKIYPYQMWLDGLYMAEPFYARYTEQFENGENLDDVILQFTLVYEKTLDPKTGLLYHAWNENKKEKWADPVTGQSPHFWGRAIGWYMMAIVDVLDFIPENNPHRASLIKILQDVSGAVLSVRDPETGLWFQILDLPDRAGNYLEASCAAMFCYSFAKGANKGYLDESYLKIADTTFSSILNIHTEIDEDGLISLYNTCSGAGLGGNPYRDGTFEYYISEPIRKNDYKGFGPLIFAAIELKR